jgi:hypothetical protein
MQGRFLTLAYPSRVSVPLLSPPIDLCGNISMLQGTATRFTYKKVCAQA